MAEKPLCINTLNPKQLNTLEKSTSLTKNAQNNTFPWPKNSEKICKFIFYYLEQYAVISNKSNFGHFQWKSESR